MAQEKEAAKAAKEAEKEAAKAAPESEAKQRYRKLLAAYEKQNPVKWELKKAVLLARLEAMQ